MLWEKAARLAPLAGDASRPASVGDLACDPACVRGSEAALEEACAVAAADGVQLAAAEQWAIIEAMPATLTTSRRATSPRAARPSSTRSRAPSSVPVAGSASRRRARELLGGA